MLGGFLFKGTDCIQSCVGAEGFQMEQSSVSSHLRALHPFRVPCGYLLAFLGFCGTQKAPRQPSIFVITPLCLDLEGAAATRCCLLSHTAASFKISAMLACKSQPGVSLVFLTVPQRGGGEGHGPSPENQPCLSVICTQFFLIACVVGVGS